jgi:hypothetical protein
VADYVAHCPEDFVTIGSPFMMFFSFEALAKLGRHDLIMEQTRLHWGKMLAAGATTTWETIPSPMHSHTRSHAHAWSAGPTYFLSSYQLGVRPVEPGWKKALIAPVPLDLEWARGRVPTPYGEISVSWWQTDEGLEIDFQAPDEIVVELQLPE